jgi:hypothetical protein
MVRCCVVVVVLAILLSSLSFAAPKGPLTAGTAPGSLVGRPATTQHSLGVHYPFNGTVLETKPNGAPPGPTNHTAPYDQWSDPGLVAGHRPAMTSDFVVIASHRRGTPHKA